MSVNHATIIYATRDACACRSLAPHICLTAAVTKRIATSLVSSRLDYCNSILYNIPNHEINQLTAWPGL